MYSPELHCVTPFRKLPRPQQRVYSCPFHYCTFRTSEQFKMQDHLNRRHPDWVEKVIAGLLNPDPPATGETVLEGVCTGA